MDWNRNTFAKKGLWIGALVIGTSLLSGCLGAIAIPLATTAGVTAVTSSAVDRTNSYAVRVSRMNCSQLRGEYRKLQKDTLGRANPLGHWAGRRAAVQSSASRRGCKL